MQWILLILGLGIIVKSANVLIDSSTKIARSFGVSSFIIGITVIAFGTSAPELAVGIISGITRTNQLTLGNILGSSLSNMAFIVGISAIIMPLKVRDTVIKREIPMLMGLEIILAAMILMDNRLSRLEGIILVMAFAAFMFYIVSDTQSSMKIKIDPQGDIDTDNDGNQISREIYKKESSRSLFVLVLFSLLSLIGLFAGGQLTVNSSTQIAQNFGLSQTLIGLTVVSMATTMPELITSIMAALKKEPDIVMGNCIGSNIFNILLVLGLSAIISPISVDESLWMDIAAMLILTLFVLFISLIKKKIHRETGIFLLIAYTAYILYKVLGALN